MKRVINPLVGAFVLIGLLIAPGGFSILTVAQDSAEDLTTALAAIQSSPPTPPSELPESGTFQSAQHPFDWPPFPGNVHELPAWPLGDGFFLLDDADFDYEALAQLMAAAGFPFGGPLMSPQTYTGNDLWLEINGVTNGCTGWTADLTIHTPEGDTNSSYDLLYSPTLASPTDWQFLMRCPTTNVTELTNVFARYLCEEQGYFCLTQTNGDLTVMTNVTAQRMAEMLVPPWVTVTNVTYTGATVARGTFTNGNGCGLPMESGVILSSGDLSNVAGTNDSSGRAPNAGLGTLGDTNLAKLVGGGLTTSAAVLEFDIIATNSFLFQLQYAFASEEYPEYIGEYNDPMAILATTNRVGTQWVISSNNNIALVPGTANLAVGVGSINGGCVSDFQGEPVFPTNAQYYVDNDDPSFEAMPPYSVGVPMFNIEFDGMTIRLTAHTALSADVTNHVKIAIADYAGEENDDEYYDSVLFLQSWSLGHCQ